MEQRPTPEYAEAIPDPNLLEVYADRELTVFGITGPLGDLAKMCPVDLSDPRVSAEAINTFVVKAMNEAEQEIEPEHQDLFARIIKEQAVDSKITVAVEHKNTAPKTPDITKKTLEAEQYTHVVKEDAASRVVLAQQLSAERARAAIAEEGASSQIVQRVSAIQERQQEILHNETAEQQQSSEDIVMPVAKQVIVTRAAELVGGLHVAKLARVEALNEMRTTPRIPPENEHGQHDDAKALERSLDGALGLPTLELPSVPAAGQTEEMSDSLEQAIVLDWVAELQKEPVEIYDDITSALARLAESMDGSTEAEKESATADGELFGADQLQEVVELLDTLDDNEKELAAPILRDILGAVHGYHVLESKGTDERALESVKQQLAELCTQLFEQIGKEYEPADVQRFVELLLGEVFEQQLAMEQEVDLETAGTHEAKHHFPQIADDLVAVPHHLWRSLGTLVLNSAIAA